MCWLWVVVGVTAILGAGPYQPTWASLNTRPTPEWYDEAKVGIFLHWGVFSVPAYGCGNATKNGPGGTAAEWYEYLTRRGHVECLLEFQNKTFGPHVEYGDFAALFRPKLFDANQWMDVIARSGARYFVFTSKHCDGFCNWPSPQAWNWNSVTTGPGIDIVGHLVAAGRAKGLHVGLYYSLMEWFNPLFMADEASGFNQREFPPAVSTPQLHDLVARYQPDLLWADGYEGNATYWRTLDFLAWLFNSSPIKSKIAVNDRWGGHTCEDGGYLTCHDRFNPGHPIGRKWENALSLDTSTWGYNRGSPLSNYMNITQLLYQLISTVSCGGNLLMNVGPNSDGVIPPVFVNLLDQLGDWLALNGEAVYSTVPWKWQNDTKDHAVWYTAGRNNSVVYATLLEYPAGDHVVLQHVHASHQPPTTTITLVGYGVVPVSWEKGSAVVTLPNLMASPTMRRMDAWVLRMEGVIP